MFSLECSVIDVLHQLVTKVAVVCKLFQQNATNIRVTAFKLPPIIPLRNTTVYHQWL